MRGRPLLADLPINRKEREKNQVIVRNFSETESGQYVIFNNKMWKKERENDEIMAVCCVVIFKLHTMWKTEKKNGKILVEVLTSFPPHKKCVVWRTKMLKSNPLPHPLT